MKYAICKNNTRTGLSEKFAEELSRGIFLIENLEDEIYVQSIDEKGSIGAHFRHNIEFIAIFLADSESGKIDYGKRLRDARIEQDRQYAGEKIRVLIAESEKITSEMWNREISVCSEIDETVWHKTSIGRELEFLLSHTTHHHAIIAEKLRQFEIKIPTEFGVATSTLKFWNGKATADKS